MASLQEQARALGDPTRHEIHRYITDADEPVGVAELTDHLGLHHNAVRQHLTKLVAADLIVERPRARGRRGRPRLEYSTSPRADSRWGAIGPYQRLSLLLAEIVATGDTPVEVGRRAGHRLRVESTDDALADAAAALDQQGFEPHVARKGDAGDVVLSHCPFAAAAGAEDGGDVVCELHRGIAIGLVDGTDFEVDDLVIEDPIEAGCRVRLRRRGA